MYKRLTPCIFIERGKAVQWFDDRTVIADDVMELARHYNERGADELIIFDLSDSDEEHDETINLLKQTTVQSVFQWLSEETSDVQKM